MFQIILLLISIIFSCEALAQQKIPPSLEEITAGLKAKKAAMEPFNSKDVKVDVESLGLDNVDKKSSEQPTVAVEIPAPVTTPVEEVTPPAAKSAIIKPEKKVRLLNTNPPVVLPVEGQSKNADKPVPTSDGTAKINNFLQKSEKKLEVETVKPAPAEEVKATGAPTMEEKVEAPAIPEKKVTPEKKNKTQRYINLAKKRELKKRLEAEKRRKIYEKNRQENAKKLRALRAQYLITTDEESAAENEIESIEYDEAKIVPQKKNLNRFISEEPPALPIMTRFRTADNLHIPMPLTDLERQNILFDAIASGNIAFFNSAYKDIENPNVRNQLGDTVLTYAILLQKYPVMASVLSKGADPNLPNGLGYSPADIAIELLDIKALEILVNNKLDINYTDAFGRTALMHASRVGFLPAIELLVSKGVDVNAMDNDGFTALSIAYRHKKEVIVKFLLKNGAKPWIEKPYNPEQQSLIQELENYWK